MNALYLLCHFIFIKLPAPVYQSQDWSHFHQVNSVEITTAKINVSTQANFEPASIFGRYTLFTFIIFFCISWQKLSWCMRPPFCLPRLLMSWTRSLCIVKIWFEITMTFSWSSHDFLMTFSWLSHDFLMTFSWLSDDFLMNFSWISYEFGMTFSWLSHDFLMNFVSISHDFFMTVSWLSLEFLMTFSWFFACLSREFLLIFFITFKLLLNDFLMSFSWLSHDIIMIFL